MVSQDLKRKLAAIISADVEGYSRLMAEDEAETVRTLVSYRELMVGLVEGHRGRVVDSPGDNVLAEFASVMSAVQCAVEIQRVLKAKNAVLPETRRMQFRIGINLGDVIEEGERIYGDGVNIAARVEGLTEAGGICISGVVYDSIENKSALVCEYLGEYSVKNIARPIRVYRVWVESPPAGSRVARIATGGMRHWQRAILALTVLAVMAIGTEAAWNLYLHPSSSPARGLPAKAQPPKVSDGPSIAVLPFVNMSGDLEEEYLSDGITEDLTTDLSKISGLFVIARNSAFTYKGKVVKVEQVSRELGVRYIVEGSIRKERDRVRITAQLIDASTGTDVWAERYDRELTSVFDLQDEITQRIVAALEVKVMEVEQERVMRKATVNLNAYDYALRGRWYAHRYSKEANSRARELYEKAIALDPSFGMAYAGLGWTYYWEWANQWSQDPKALERATELGKKAVVLDDIRPEAHSLLGHVYLLQRQYEQAIAEQEKAINLDPNDADSYASLAEVLIWTGRPERAIGLVEKAMRLNPHDQVQYLFTLGYAYLMTGQYEKAVAAQKEALTHNPDYLGSHLILAEIYSELGREEEARAQVAEVQRINPDYSLVMARRRLPFKDTAQLEHALAALGKAGLK